MKEIVHWLLQNITAVIGIGVSLTLFIAREFWIIKRRETKSLVYWLSDYTLIGDRKGTFPDFELLYAGKSTNDIRVIEIKVLNEGKQVIKSEDYSTPITLSFDKATEFISMNVVNSNPKILQANPSVSDSIIELRPTLMNPGNYFVFRIFIPTDKQIKFDVGAHISGGSRDDGLRNGKQGFGYNLSTLRIQQVFVIAVLTCIPFIGPVIAFAILARYYHNHSQDEIQRTVSE